MIDLFISTTTFTLSTEIKYLLKKNKISYRVNNLKRKLKPIETLKLSSNCKYLIAGTENLDEIVKNNKRLQFICRLGTGIENVPIKELKKRKIILSCTPEGLSDAVSEFTLSSILNLLRKINYFDQKIKKGIWKKELTKSINESVVGVIGTGNIGSKVIEKIEKFNPSAILVYDKKRSKSLQKKIKILKYVTLQKLLKLSDIVTIHVPLNKKTINILSLNELGIMKDSAILINSSRGGLVNEDDLFRYLRKNKNFYASFDTFEDEPYNGKLLKLKNFIATPHVASQTEIAREKMEKSSILEIINFKRKLRLNNQIKLNK